MFSRCHRLGSKLKYNAGKDSNHLVIKYSRMKRNHSIPKLFCTEFDLKLGECRKFHECFMCCSRKAKDLSNWYFFLCQGRTVFLPQMEAVFLFFSCLCWGWLSRWAECVLAVCHHVLCLPLACCSLIRSQQLEDGEGLIHLHADAYGNCL